MREEEMNELLEQYQKFNQNTPPAMYTIIKYENKKFIEVRKNYLKSVFLTLGLSALYYPNVYVEFNEETKDIINEFISFARKKGVSIFYND